TRAPHKHSRPPDVTHSLQTGTVHTHTHTRAHTHTDVPCSNAVCNADRYRHTHIHTHTHTHTCPMLKRWVQCRQVQFTHTHTHTHTHTPLFTGTHTLVTIRPFLQLQRQVSKTLYFFLIM